MGRGLRGCRSGGVRGGGFRSVSGSKSGAGVLNLSVSQQQDDLLKNYPGIAYAYPRPISGGPLLASSEFGSSGKEYPYEYCQNMLMFYYDAVRVCGSDCVDAVASSGYLEALCGIEVSPDVSEKKVTDEAAAAAHL